MRYLSFLFIVIWSFGVGCGGGQQMLQNNAESPCPDWFNNPPVDPEYLFSVATATSRDLQMAINKAKQQALLDIAGQIETRVKGLAKQFTEEIGLGEDAQFNSQMTQAIKTVVSTTINGAKPRFQNTSKEGVLWRACVLMELPMGELKAQFMQNLKNREILRQKLRASEAFQELEEEVEKYEQEKRTSEKSQ